MVAKYTCKHRIWKKVNKCSMVVVSLDPFLPRGARCLDAGVAGFLEDFFRLPIAGLDMVVVTCVRLTCVAVFPLPPPILY